MSHHQSYHPYLLHLIYHQEEEEEEEEEGKE